MSTLTSLWFRRRGFFVWEGEGPDGETKLGDRYAYTASVGARVTIPIGSGQ